MTLVTLRSVNKQLGGHPILTDVDWSIGPGERIGLVGANGAGKTTLLEVLTGELVPETGEVSRARRLRLGFHRQIPDLPDRGTVREAAERSLAEIKGLEQELRRLEESMAESKDEALVARHGEAIADFEHRGGWDYPFRTDRILTGLGFGPDRWGQGVETLSGGEKVRLGLAGILLAEPDLLLLDEPTNHLDLPTIRWLEDWLVGRQGSVVVVSHDRAFLDRVAEKIVFLDHGRLRLFRGNYSQCRRLREEADRRAGEDLRRLDEEIARNEDFVRRNIAGQNTKQAQSREKRIEKLRAERADVLRPQERVLSLDLTEAPRLGNDGVKLSGIALRVEGRTLLAGLDLEIHAGDRMGILGPVGSGKSTLLAVLTGSRAPDEGTVEIGKTVVLGHHRQEHDDLVGSKTVLARIEEERRQWFPGVCRSYLARFGFRGEQVSRELDHLSGGERSRLALSLLLLSGANVLLLDEPTNHLDIEGRESLEESLLQFPGALVVVSHDRAFLDAIATRLLVLDGRGRFRTSKGGYSADRDAIEAFFLDPVAPARPAPRRTPAAAPVQRGEDKPRVKRRYTFKDLEAKIFSLEVEQREVAEAIGREENYKDAGKLGALDRRRVEIERELESLMAEWESWA